MYRNLSPGAVGISADVETTMKLAVEAGFEGIELPGGVGPERLRELLDTYGLRLGAMGLPVDFRHDKEAYEAGLAKLPAAAAAAAAAGCTRCATWLMPFSDELSYTDNFRQHVERLRPVARILADNGIRFGLEYVAPATSRQGHAHDFVHTLPQVLELCGAIGGDNLGVLLDCWHWYTAGETLDDLKRLDNRLVVQVHVNDAPQGKAIQEQVDNVRDLPAATGVIDIAGFMKALDAMGYDGPVTPEPFCAELKSLGNDAVATRVGEALDAVWRKAGL